jgi:Fanconi anemia group M protein
MNAFQIIISNRLKDNPVTRLLGELGTDIRQTTLRRGDMVLNGRFGIKYYSSEEFLKAIRDRSIYREILELKREYSDPIIIVEGKDPFHDTELSLASIHGAVLFASVPNRVPILITKNDLETAQMIFMMAAQTSNSVDWQMAAAAAGAAPKIASGDNGQGDPRISIISRLPEVGPSLAKGLLKHFGSLSRLFAAKIRDLKKVEGIGPKRAEKIFAFLNGNKAA